MTSNTANKEDFINELFDLIDASVTASIAVDASASTVVTVAQIQNYLKLVATNTAVAGANVALPVMTKMFILGNDKASPGNATFKVGTATIVLTPGQRCIAHLDGTANGLEVVSAGGAAAAAALATLTDVDLSTVPTDGQALLWSQSEGKWHPGTVSTGGGGTVPPPTGGGNATTAHSYYRMRIFDTDDNNTLDGGGNATFAGFDLYDASGAHIPYTSGTTFGYLIHGNYPAANAFDGDPNSIVSSSAAVSFASPMVIGYIFAAAVTVGSVKVQASTGYQGHTPHDWTLDYSDDGINWHSGAGSFRNAAAWAAGEVRAFPFTNAS